MYNHRFLRSRIFFFFSPPPLLFKREEMKASQQSESFKESWGKKSWKKSCKRTKSNLLKRNAEAVDVSGRSGNHSRLESLNDSQILTALARSSSLVTGFDRLIVCFAAVMSFTVCV